MLDEGASGCGASVGAKRHRTLRMVLKGSEISSSGWQIHTIPAKWGCETVGWVCTMVVV